MTAPRCASCLIGVGVAVTLLANPVFTADDSALILTRRPAYRCSVCAHVWTVGPEPARPASAVCDFCSDREPVTAFPCRDFVLEFQPGLEDRSIGPWATCQGCAELIRRGRRDGLVERGVLSFIRRFPEMAAAMPPGHLTSDFRRRFNAFWINRITEETRR